MAKKIIISVLIVFLLNLLFYKLTIEKLSHEEYEVEINVNYSQDGILEIFYDIGEGFNEEDSQKKIIKKGDNLVQFIFENDEKFNQIRLDFGDIDYLVDTIKINTLKISANEKELVNLNKKVYKEIIVTSSSIESKEENLIPLIKEGIDYDPFIVFKKNYKLFTFNYVYILLFIVPFLLLFSVNIYKYLSEIQIIDFLFVLLIISFPFQESWMNLPLFVLVLYSLFDLIKERKINFRIDTLILLLLIIIPVFVGRPTSYKDINLLMTFFLFSIISCSSIKINYLKIYKAFSIIALFYMIMLITIWLNYMLYYSVFDNVGLREYFKEVKNNNELFREWIPYSHPTYSSLFFIFSLFFSSILVRKKLLKKNFLYVSLLLTLLILFILGSRISMLLYLFILVQVFCPNINVRKGYYFFWILPILLFCSINYFDSLRSELWDISYQSIKDHLFFGTGLRSSRIMIQHYFPQIESLTERGIDVYQLSILKHSHNQFITWALELGVVGVSLLLGGIGYFIKRYNKNISHYFYIILFFWILICSTESITETAKGIFLFGLTLCLLNNKILFSHKFNK